MLVWLLLLVDGLLEIKKIRKMVNYNKVFSVRVYSYYYVLERTFAWVLFNTLFRFKVEGQENIDYSRSFLILANHCSYIDPMLVGIAVKKPIAYMAKAEIFKVPLLNKIARWSGAFAVNRGSGDNSFLNNTVYALKTGWLINMFPEGGRSPDGKFMQVKPGAAKVLLAEPVPFLPVAIINTHNAWGKKRKIKFFTQIGLKIGKPVYPEEYMPDESLSETEKIKHIADIYAAKLIELLPQEHR